MMHYLTFLLIIFSQFAFVAKDTYKTTLLKKAEKPCNVIFILSDDHRYDFMSFMNNSVPWLQTPNLDRSCKERKSLTGEKKFFTNTIGNTAFLKHLRCTQFAQTAISLFAITVFGTPMNFLI